MPTPQPRRKSDGTTSWRVRYRIGRDQRSETFYTASEAQEFCTWIGALGPERAVGLLRDRDTELEPRATTPTLDEWAERYIATLPSASAATKAEYRSSYKHSFGHHIGAMHLDTITRETIAATITQLQTRGGRGGNGYSDKSIANHHGLLSAMMATAVADGLIPVSPCTRIRLPRSTDHEETPKRFLTHEEFARLWSSTTEHHRRLLEVLVGTGIRWGEAEALTVGDVDHTAGLLRVSKAAKRTGSGSSRAIGPTKTRRSRRAISVGPDLLDVLEQAAGGRGRGERLFLAPQGGHLVHRNFWESCWAPACKRAGLIDPRPRIHDLRHTHASWMIAEGVDMKTLQERLGHESIVTTMDLYGHLMPDARAKAAAAAEAALAKSVRGSALRPVDGEGRSVPPAA